MSSRTIIGIRVGRGTCNGEEEAFADWCSRRHPHADVEITDGAGDIEFEDESDDFADADAAVAASQDLWEAYCADQTSERFTMRPETFTDTANGAEWTREVSEPLTLEAAHAHARDCRAGGHKNWRVPECDELLTLVDRSRHAPATWPELRDCTPSVWLWTATPYAPSSAYAWLVDFYSGYALSNVVTYTGRVRCVR